MFRNIFAMDRIRWFSNLLRNLEPKNRYENMVPLTNNQVDIPSLKLGANSQMEITPFSSFDVKIH